jgi:hypothetical protein
VTSFHNLQFSGKYLYRICLMYCASIQWAQLKWWISKKFSSHICINMIHALHLWHTSFKKNNYTSVFSIKTEILNLNVITHMCVHTTRTLKNSHTHIHTHVFYGKKYSLNKTLEIDFTAQIKNLEQNVKQQNK